MMPSDVSVSPRGYLRVLRKAASIGGMQPGEIPTPTLVSLSDFHFHFPSPSSPLEFHSSRAVFQGSQVQPKLQPPKTHFTCAGRFLSIYQLDIQLPGNKTWLAVSRTMDMLNQAPSRPRNSTRFVGQKPMSFDYTRYRAFHASCPFNFCSHLSISIPHYPLSPSPKCKHT